MAEMASQIRIAIFSFIFSLGAIPLQAQTPVSGYPVPELGALDTTMSQIMSQWSVPGATLAVTYNGRLVFAHGYGYADVAAREPVQPDSLFRVASLSKPFTAAAILKLIEQGKLQLGTRPFTTLLGDLTPPPGKTKDPRLDSITIQNLLEHKAGWDDTAAGVPDPAVAYVDLAAQTFGVQPPADPATLIRYMLGEPLQHDPGSVFAYSNFGYIVLGLIIERASGQTYGDFVKSYIQNPAAIGRMQLGRSVLSGRLPGEVTYYDYPGAPQVPSVVQPLYSLVPIPYGGFSLELLAAAGGWVASATDLLRYVDTMNGQLAPPILQSPPTGFVGYVPPVGNYGVWFFYGSLPGTNTLLHLDNNVQLTGKVSWAVLFNTRSGASTAQPQTDADAKIFSALQAVRTWPSLDLFPIYGRSGSSCGFSLSNSLMNVGVGGGTGSVSISDTNYCAWTATSNTSWISVTSGLSGSDSGVTVLSVDANSAAATRTGTVTIAGQTFTVTQTGTATPSSTALRFVPVTPCRVADTRSPAGAFGGPSLTARVPRDFVISSSACGVPGNAQAYSLNVTVIPKGALQFLTVWPSGQPQPNVSTLNSFDGRIKANAAIVPAGSNGAITAFASDDSHFILDINGYFIPAAQSALAFFPTTPCRVVDTRYPNGPLSGPPLPAGTIRTIPILSGSCGLPPEARAYSLNFTVVPRGSLSYLTVWPAGQPQPGVSTLNAPTGTTANAAIVSAGQNGDISVFSTADTDLIVDSNGYFAPAATGGLSLYNVLPCRVADTRFPPGSQATSGTTPVNVAASVCGVPFSSQAFVLNATVVPPGRLAYLSIWPNGQPQPVVSTLNAVDGTVSSNMALVPAANGSLSIFASNPTYLILDVSGYFAP